MRWFCCFVLLAALAPAGAFAQPASAPASAPAAALLIDIEYCPTCGYVARAQSLARQIEAQFGAAARVTMHAGRPGAFEIRVGDVLLHSKLGGQGWPDEAAVLEAIRGRLP